MTDLWPHGAKWLKAGLILTACVALGLSLERDEPKSLQLWHAVVPGPIEHRIGLVGRIVPGTSIILTAPFEGHIEEKNFAEDQRVPQGELLLKIGPDLLHLQIRDSLAERLKAESAVQALDDWANGEEMARARRAVSTSQLSLDDTRRKLAETRTLLEQGIVPRMELDSLTQQLKTQTLDLDAARAELAQVRKRAKGEHRQIADMQLANARARHEALLALASRGEVRAPFPGIVMRLPEGASAGNEKPIEAGVRLSQGQPLFGLASVERLNVQARVDESDINQLREGMPVEIRGDGFEDLLQGTVTAVGAQAIASDMHGDNAAYHLVVALAPLEGAIQQRLRLGMSAHLSILTYHNPNAVVLPVDAVVEKGGQHFVVHRTAMNSPETRRSVTLGKATVSGVEVFGMDAGFVLREVGMD